MLKLFAAFALLATPALAAPAKPAPVKAAKAKAPTTLADFLGTAAAKEIAAKLKISLAQAAIIVAHRAKTPIKHLEDATGAPGLEPGTIAALHKSYGGLGTLQPKDKAKIRALIRA